MKGQRTVTASDGLPALVTGSWSIQKHDYIHRLARIFSTGMKNKWQHRCFIDLFSGPGKCVSEETGEEIRGSPFQGIIDVPDPFTQYLFNDIDPASIDALKSRIQRHGTSLQVRYFVDDCNSVVPKVRAQLPPVGESLELAVVDAWGWEMKFDALAALTEGRRMDLIITFPLGFMKRNWRRQLNQLDQFLGGDD